MTITDSRDLYWRFRQAAGLPFNRNTWRVYLKFLGIEDESTYSVHYTRSYINKAGEVVDLPEDAKHKLEWLGGPHYKALYAAWRARNGQG